MDENLVNIYAHTYIIRTHIYLNIHSVKQVINKDFNIFFFFFLLFRDRLKAAFTLSVMEK